MTAGVSTAWSFRDQLLFGVLPPLLLLVAVFVEFLAPYSTRFAGWPFAVSLLFLGLPHGAADLAVSSKLDRSTSWLQTLSRFSGYTALMLVVLAITVVAPTAAVAAFALFSVWHFGAADTEDLQDATGGASRQSLGGTIARGNLILAAPFAFRPTESVEVVDSLLHLLGGTAIAPATAFLVAISLVAVALLVLMPSIVSHADRGLNRSAGLEMVELVSLLLLFGTLHPLFAMGWYFLTWHSWRHARRLIAFLDDNRIVTLTSLARLHVRSLPLLVPTLCVVAALLWSRPQLTAYDLAIVAIGVFVVVTPPHHFLVERLHGRNRSERSFDGRPIVGETPTKVSGNTLPPASTPFQSRSGV